MWPFFSVVVAKVAILALSSQPSAFSLSIAAISFRSGADGRKPAAESRLAAGNEPSACQRAVFDQPRRRTGCRYHEYGRHSDLTSARQNCSESSTPAQACED